jgi:hypothetical protein
VDVKFDDVADILPGKERKCSIKVRCHYLFIFILVAFQAMSNAIDVDSDVDSYDTDDADDFQSMKFVKDLIVTPPTTRGKAEVGSDVPA